MMLLAAVTGCRITALQFEPRDDQREISSDGTVAIASRQRASTALVATQAAAHENGQQTPPSRMLAGYSPPTTIDHAKDAEVLALERFFPLLSFRARVPNCDVSP